MASLRVGIEPAERLLGYTREEALGQHITLIIPEDRLDEDTTSLIVSGEVSESTILKPYGGKRTAR